MKVNPNDFVHLHGHSKYSVNDGMANVEALVDRAKELEFQAIALTEHGKMGSIPRFAFACKDTKNGPAIQGIIGCEMYLAEDMHVKQTITLDDGRSRRPRHHHVPLLCASEKGFHNLVAMLNDAYIDGFYHEPRIDWNLLSQHSEGLVALSGCLGGEISQAILNDDYGKALQKARDYKELFGDNFFLEVQYHGIDAQLKVAKGIIKLGDKLNIPIVATQDYHYLFKSDAQAHGIMKGIRSNDGMNSGKGYDTNEFYLKSAEQMYHIWKAHPEFCKNTLMVAEKCQWQFPTTTPWQFPEFQRSEDPKFSDWHKNRCPYMTEKQAYLYYLCLNALGDKCVDNEEYRKRMQYELNVIYEMGVEDYFLILWDIFKMCHERKIGVGPGRGSGAGSLVLYLLDITMIDPIDYGLYFERFLNPGRSSQYNFELPYTLDQFKKDTDAGINYSAKFGIEGRAVREALLEELKKDDKIQYWPQVKREILPLENQKMDDYYVACYNYAKKKGKMENTANSWIAYVLDIVKDKPDGYLAVTKMGSLPDVDSDFEPARRDEVTEYCREIYGEDSVANIGTYGEYKARSALQGVLKHPEFGYDHETALEISKVIPVSQVNPLKLKEAIDIKYVSDMLSKHKVPAKAIEIASIIEGSALSSISEHAAGVVIAPHSLHDRLPLHLTGKKDLVTQYDLKDVEKTGYIKFDFLGLSNIGKIQRCINMVAQHHNQRIDLKKVPRNDAKSLKVIESCVTETVFQLSSKNIRKAISHVKIDSFDDIVAIAALYRPGPMRFISKDFYLQFSQKGDPPWEIGMTYAENKTNPDKIKYLHPDLEPILGPTHGILIFQEQCLEIVQKIGGFSLAESDVLRKAIGKKDEELLRRCRDDFLQGAKTQGYSRDDADSIWRLMEKFAGYAFNKAHSTAYALIALWDAFLLSRFPHEWYAACITEDVNKEHNYTAFIREAKSVGIKVIRPDVNHSGMETRVKYNPDGKPLAVILPLNIIKRVGKNAVDIPKHQPYKDFEDFCDKINPNKTMIDALTSANAMRDFGTRLDIIRAYEQWKFKKAERKKANKYKADVPDEISGLFDADFELSISAKTKIRQSK